MTNPRATRAVRRPQAAALPCPDAPTTRVNVGTIFGIEPKLSVEPLTGYLRQFRFLPTKAEPTTTIAWQGVNEAGGLVSGKLVLHTAVAESEVAVWGEVAVDPVP